jgi:hypothetical protein
MEKYDDRTRERKIVAFGHRFRGRVRRQPACFADLASDWQFGHIVIRNDSVAHRNPNAIVT